MDAAAFAAKWKGVKLTERAASQSHFNDLCGMLGWGTPSDLDPEGEWFAFEKGAEKLDGTDGWADVWMKDKFAWEYKGKRANLLEAYRQLNDYREHLGNPPLLVVCDLDRFEIHTNFTGTAKKIYSFTLDDLGAAPAEPLRLLRALFLEPERLRPTVTRQELTEEAAKEFADLAIALRARGHEPQAVAHFLDQLLFCLFAEDAGLLPAGVIARLSEATKADPEGFSAQLGVLFARMSSKSDRYFGPEYIAWFNGSLFDGSPALPLTAPEVLIVRRVAKLDWAEIEPAIFGTLFERGLDPGRRSQLGAHYTDRDSIVRLVEPVMMTPLRREYAAMQTRVSELMAQGYGGRRRAGKPENDPRRVFEAFLDRLRSVTVLDPACGSGNFLYIALQSLKDLERQVIHWGSTTLRIPAQFPQVGPAQLRGIEVNPYAAELARVTVWIGEIQWMLRNGFAYQRDPILRPLQNIETRDALIEWRDHEAPAEAEWPEAEFIVGNPPFLGNRLMRRALGDRYTEALWQVFDGRLSPSSDLCCYWHEKARSMIAGGRAKRAGLLATQAIRNQANRQVIQRIGETGALFFALSSEPWVLAGAAVSISYIGQDDGSEQERSLDGEAVGHINPNLTSGTDLTAARRLNENTGVCFYADVKAGRFDMPPDVAERLIATPNPDGRSNADVVRPWVNAADVTGRPRGMWIIDFGVDMPREEAALYEAPFAWVQEHVYPERLNARRDAYRKRWWLHAEPVRGMRAALAGLPRYLATPAVSKHRIFVWLPASTLADHQLVVVARDDDYAFGLLQSRVHSRWALAIGPRLETRPRYPPQMTFETFPWPRADEGGRTEIAAAAARLDELRRGWLHPAGTSDEDLKLRTLTNLYNEMPTWLQDVHERLDAAVLTAYGWPTDLPDDQVLAGLLALNLERASAAPS